MNKKLQEFFSYFRHLKSMQAIVQEIITLDNYAVNFVEDEAIVFLDYCITKYDKDIRRIGSLYQDKVVIDNDEHIYEKKSSQEINSDCEFVRDCLIIIATVQSGIRPNIQTVINEMNGC